MTFSADVAREGLFAYCVRLQQERRAQLVVRDQWFASEPQSMQRVKGTGIPVAPTSAPVIQPEKMIVPMSEDCASVEEEELPTEDVEEVGAATRSAPKLVEAGVDEPEENDMNIERGDGQDDTAVVVDAE